METTLLLIAHKSVSLPEAWSIWFSGKPTNDLMVGGHSMLFWGRVGKALQFAVALGVIIEIIGHSRLRKASSYLQNQRREIKRTVEKVLDRDPPTWMRWLVAACSMLIGLGIVGYIFLLLIDSYKVDLQTLIAYFMGTIIALAILFVIGLKVDRGAMLRAAKDMVMEVPFLLLGFPILLLTAFITLAALFSVDVIVKGVAVVLGHKSLNTWLRGIGLVVLGDGFHFDLLAT